MIDWLNPNCPVSKWFTVKECLFLKHWNRLGGVEDGLDASIQKQLVITCTKMDLVREFFGLPMVTHDCWRPWLYNSLKEIGGAHNSPHPYGMAMDFHLIGISCDQAREELKPSLGALELRMEDREGSDWIHLDTRQPGPGGRFFKP